AAVVGVQDDLDLRRVAVDDLIDRVVENLPHQVVQAVLVETADIHAGALTDVVDALDDLNGRGAVLSGAGVRARAFLLRRALCAGFRHRSVLSARGGRGGPDQASSSARETYSGR